VRNKTGRSSISDSGPFRVRTGKVADLNWTFPQGVSWDGEGGKEIVIGKAFPGTREKKKRGKGIDVPREVEQGKLP